MTKVVPKRQQETSLARMQMVVTSWIYVLSTPPEFDLWIYEFAFHKRRFYTGE
ncbi:hypothetical protein [Georhizobium profundi]|jgi:hypothetical protein|uniref:hypothetical protein n=1 Tax=Georhizobium profundi TaxID=2341112 RepID=UPI0013E0CDC0|nr:hypothetical protein [Georhizobium profundi]